jgi:thiamine kinase-like enzyme
LDASAGELDALLDRIPVLQGVRRTVEELDGGLTNQNLHVVTDDHDLVVRVFRGDATLLGIDRDAEHHNTRAAAEAGVGAPVVDYLPDPGVLVIGYLQGVTLENSSFTDPGVIQRAADACRNLHTGPRFRGDFDMFRRQATYRRTVGERGYRLFAGYDDHADDWRRVQTALEQRAGSTVPCNNDLLAENFIDDGERIWLIDYEYSGNNDPCFELGNQLVARVRLQSLVSQYGWSLWGAIQASASTLDFDFMSWGQERFEKAARTFTSPELDRMLDAVVRDD